MPTRYAITFIDKDGNRALAMANQSRNHFDTQKEADDYLTVMKSVNSADTLKSLFGDIETLRADPIECYNHGDATRTIFPNK